MLHGSERQWLAYLHEVVELIDRSGASANQSELVARAQARARAVISNHHNLLLALPGRAADLTAADRARLAATSTRPKEAMSTTAIPTPTAPGELTPTQQELRQRARRRSSTTS